MTSKVSKSTDTELVASVAAGEIDAFSVLYQRHVDGIYRYVYHRLGSAADAERVTGEVFLRTYRAILDHEIHLAIPLRAWLYRIAHTLVVEQMRSRSGSIAHANSVSDSTQGQNRDAALVIDAISALPDTQQQVITLKFIENLSTADVASALGISEAEVKVIQHRALRSLRTQLSAATR